LIKNEFLKIVVVERIKNIFFYINKRRSKMKRKTWKLGFLGLLGFLGITGFSGASKWNLLLFLHFLWFLHFLDLKKK